MPEQPTTVTELAALSPAEADRYFAEEDPEVLVALVGDASDQELRRLVGTEHVRQAAVTHILGRLAEFAVPERLALVDGVVEFCVDVPDGDPERHGLVFSAGSLTVAEPGGYEPDVTLALGALEFARLVTGGENAALLLLADRLRVIGDADLALRMGGVFRVPGRPGVAVDPADVDPAEVARVLGTVTDAHLREVMAGGFRDVILAQVFDRFPEFLDAEKAREHRLSIGFTIRGRADGEADRWVVHVADGRCRVEPGGEHRQATIATDGASFLKLVTGHLNPVKGVMGGALKVRGDLAAALTLHKIMRIPGAG
jgi:putative sterol carrier protein